MSLKLPADVTAMKRVVVGYVPPTMYVWGLNATNRARHLEHLRSFYDGTQHNHQDSGWNGTKRIPGVAYMNERLNPMSFVPGYTQEPAPGWGNRRPDTPHGIHRQIVTRFTDLVLSDTSRPSVTVPSDPSAESYVSVIMDISNTWSSLQQARDYKGSCGSAAVALSVVDGIPTSEALMTSNLWVRSWAQGPDWVPSEIIEQKLVTEEVASEERDGVIETISVWRTRVWTQTHLVLYRDVPEDYNVAVDGSALDEMPSIPVDEVYEHRAGRVPVVWMQNTRNTESPEGEEDVRGTFENSDKLDRVRSFAVRATIANTDPTLVRSDEQRFIQRNLMVRKGHGSEIRVSEKGSVRLLETSGSSVEMAWKTANTLRHDILQAASCVIVDPDTAPAYKSGEALIQLYLAMFARASRLRVPLSSEIRQIVEIWLSIGRSLGVASTEDDDEAQIGKLVLPPRVEKNEDGEIDVSRHDPGRARHVQIRWGEFHKLTMAQVQALLGSLVTANGANPVLSRRTATELAVTALGVGSVEDELERIAEDQKEDLASAARDLARSGSMFPGVDVAGDGALDDERQALSKMLEEDAPQRSVGSSSNDDHDDD